MRVITAACIVGLASHGIADLSIRQAPGTDPSAALQTYFRTVCFPTNATGWSNLDAPCNAYEAVKFQCGYGHDAWISAMNDDNSNTTDFAYPITRNLTSPAAQQVCFCESQYFNLLQGCLGCANKHGLGAIVPQISSSAIASVSSNYCAVSATPTTDLENFFASAFTDALNSAESGTASTFSDPIGNKTDISLYYTASVTGTAAYIVSQPDPTASAGAAASTSVSINTSGGQIVATAQAAAVAATSTKPASSSSSGLAAAATPVMEHLAIAGVVGLAGAIAML